MNLEIIKRPDWVRLLVMTILLIVLVWSMLQLDMPTVGVLAEHFKITMMERQFELQTHNREDLIRQGWVYYNMGEYEKASVIMTKVAQEEQNISALYCLGLIDLLSGRYEKAVDMLKVVAVRSPEHTETRIALGKAYYELRYYRQAYTNFKQAASLEPTNEQAKLWLGKTYLKLDQKDLARQTLQSVTHGRESLEAAALLKKLHL